MFLYTILDNGSDFHNGNFFPRDFQTHRFEKKKKIPKQSSQCDDRGRDLNSTKSLAYFLLFGKMVVNQFWKINQNIDI